MQSEAPAAKDTRSRLRCMSPCCSKISSIACPRQFCASDCRRAPGGPCNSHIVKPTKPKLMVDVSHSSQESFSRPNEPLLSSDDEDIALAIKASLLPSTFQQSLSAVASSSQPRPAYTDASSSSVPSSFSSPAPKQLTIPTAIKPRISSQMAPAWQTRVEASSKAVVEKEERAARQALLQQVLKENLNILFFDKVIPSYITC